MVLWSVEKSMVPSSGLKCGSVRSFWKWKVWQKLPLRYLHLPDRQRCNYISCGFVSEVNPGDNNITVLPFLSSLPQSVGSVQCWECALRRSVVKWGCAPRARLRWRVNSAHLQSSHTRMEKLSELKSSQWAGWGSDWWVCVVRKRCQSAGSTNPCKYYFCSQHL